MQPIIDNLANPAVCLWEPAPYLIVSGNIWGNFIYYSHLFPSISVLVIAIFVFWHNPRGKAAQALLLLATAFTAWSLIDLVLWASERSDLIMFFWSILIHFDLLIYVSAFYFVHAFMTNRWPNWQSELLIALLFVPLVLFAHTSLNLTAFDFTNCWREALEGPLWQFYVYNAELFIAAWILVFAILQIRKQEDQIKKQEFVLTTVGILAFLFSFSLGNILGSLGTDWELGQYGLFGMPIFVAFLTYLMVRYQAFRAKILATEALIAGLGILIISLMFVRKIENVQAIALVTLLLTIALGILLVRSVRKEIQQREEIEGLALRLDKANSKLKALDKLKSEFVSIASHQLRSPLTAIRGYAAMLVEGSYGKVPEKAAEPLRRIEASAHNMALSVEDYLNVSRIESGNMKYSYTDFNLKDLAETITDDIRPQAMKKTLVMSFKSDMNGKGVVHADQGKVQQILHNLINNALKYTPKGTITVFAHDDKKKKKMYIEIIDTGVGMEPDTIEHLFDKFERAKDASQVNQGGAGLGLFVARKMAQAMKGDVTAHSKGKGEGSHFILELPLAM
ncbi:MAG: HAMP domain-containing sensor histidine kinase [Patescibacteria group bacterium]